MNMKLYDPGTKNPDDEDGSQEDEGTATEE